MTQNEFYSRVKAIDALNPFQAFFTSESGKHRIVELNELRRRLALALDVPYLKLLAGKLLEEDAIRNNFENMVLSPNTFRDLEAKAQRLDSAVSILEEFLRVSGANADDAKEVLIKICQNESLEVVGTFLLRLEKALGQGLSALGEDSQLKVTRWETGSLWLTIAGTSVPVAIALGGLAWAAACTYKKYYEAKVIEQMARRVRLRNDAMEVINDGIENIVEVTIAEEAERLMKRHGKGDGDSETLQRLQFCVRELYEMMMKGTEIHPSLSAPEEVANVFPKFSEITKLFSESRKLLSEDGNQSVEGE